MNYQTKKIAISNLRTYSSFIFENDEACYTVYGDLEDHKKVALFFHGFSSNSELHSWWEKFNFLQVLKSYNIICINSLGSSHGSLGPRSINPATKKPYFGNFPAIKIQDTVDFTMETLKQLDINKVDLAFGCSLGGMQVLDMFLRYPDISKKFISVAGVPVPYMTKLINLAQARLIDEAVYQNRLSDLETMLGLSRFFFRLSCTTEDALTILEKKRNPDGKMNSLKALEEYFVKDNLNFQNIFCPYSNSLYLKMIANFELSEIRYAAKQHPELVIVSIENDSFTPEKYVDKVYAQLVEKGYSATLRDFKTAFGHEAWIVDGEKFYDFIEADLNL